ncbi:ski-like protein isoform X2 [Amia ocellicauda]|uniref:ski-like protein isoform X2 n=1 Tax=Amia ocellicauda TaxID=2972642 RepID=UPI003464A85A
MTRMYGLGTEKNEQTNNKPANKTRDTETTMASTQTGLKPPFKEVALLKGNVKRLCRERLEDAPIKKRVVAEINLKRRSLEGVPKSPKVKKEYIEDCGEGESSEGERIGNQLPVPGAKALDLSPGLKHTLAQFHLSSQSSLGGPAAFSARNTQESSSPNVFVPLPSPPVLPGPLLIPCDSSTELTHSLLEGESISCFMVGGEKRLCLPQVLNSVLRDFSLQQINTVCDELYIYCSRCNADQLHILKVLGILPFNAPSCGLITLTDAQRLCNALLRPGTLPQGTPCKLSEKAQLKESEAVFEVEHECLGKCQGLFVPHFYTQPDAPCIQCGECQLMFSPQKFVMHSHKSPDKRTCHWGFDSAKWPCYLQLGRKYFEKPEEIGLKRLLEEMKEKFHFQQKRPLEKDPSEEALVKKTGSDLCAPPGKLAETEPNKKVKSQSIVFNQLYPEIKEDPDHADLIHPSYYLYMYDKVVAPNVSLPHSLSQARELGKAGGREGDVSSEMLGALLKQHYIETRRGALPHHDDPHSQTDRPSPSSTELHTTSCSADEVKSRHVSEHGPLAVAIETDQSENAYTPFVEDMSREDDKDRIVVEIVQMYNKQQEKLNTTLHKQMQLQMELQALRGGEAARLRELSAEHSELQSELEAVHTEHAQRLGEVRQEQKELERRLEQLRQQNCACEPSSDRDQEAHYAAQLSELRQRLDQAEADRLELQEELLREREAREKLERVISELKQQISESSATGSPPSPASSHTDTNPEPSEVAPAEY